MNWIPHPTILEGKIVRLVPLEVAHFEELYEIAADKKLWEFYPIDCSDRSTFDASFHAALIERQKGNLYPFVIFHNETNKIIGSTRLMDIYPMDKKLEIGYTWLAQKFWGTAINFECKWLLLTFCFERLGAVRVQLKTKDSNIRSRTAILKIGATFEGILRKDKMQDSGEPRNSAFFSILDDEWAATKAKIETQMDERLAK